MGRKPGSKNKPRDPAAPKRAKRIKAPKLSREETKRQQDAFLAAYANCGTLTDAETESGVSRNLHYKWMAKKRYADLFNRIEEELEANRKMEFLAKLRITGGNIALACAAAKIPRSKHYDWMQQDKDYAKAYESAREDAADLLEAEAKRRAVEGVLEPVFYKGIEVAKVRKRSDTLLMFLLNGLRPEKYRQGTDVSVNVQVGIAEQIKAARERVAALGSGERS